MNELTRSRNGWKCYTIPDGEYDGVWQHKFCWVLNDKGEIISRFPTRDKRKIRPLKVICKINGTQIIVYEKNKTNKTEIKNEKS